MKSAADFFALVRSDAAVQERVAAALKEKNPLDAVLAVASAAGFTLDAGDLQSLLAPSLSDDALNQVAGGGAFRAPAEWFAEVISKGPGLKTS
jgi:predicted ribosomally synthesized peptide with nif11-like leader